MQYLPLLYFYSRIPSIPLIHCTGKVWCPCIEHKNALSHASGHDARNTSPWLAVLWPPCNTRPSNTSGCGPSVVQHCCIPVGRTQRFHLSSVIPPFRGRHSLTYSFTLAPQVEVSPPLLGACLSCFLCEWCLPSTFSVPGNPCS